MVHAARISGPGKYNGFYFKESGLYLVSVTTGATEYSKRIVVFKKSGSFL